MEVGVLEAKNRLSELLDLAEKGESVTITRRGKPIATLNAVKPAFDLEARKKLVAEVAAARKTLPPITREEIRAAIHGGHRY
jgi:prevent-host-death family protein